MNILESTNGIEFYVSPTYSLEDLHRVQKRSIEMFEQIAAILDRHEIPYTLGYGSLLGQVRHSGYIPWDDDIDLFIFDQDYARAILLLRSELPDGLLLHNKRNDPIYWVTWVKVRDLGSDTVESMWKIDQQLKYHGVAIDLLRVTTTTVGKHQHSSVIKNLSALSKKRTKKHQARKWPRRLLGLPLLTATKFAVQVQIISHRLRRKSKSQKLLVAAPGTIIEQTFAYDDVFPIHRDGPTFEGMKVPTPNHPEGVLGSMYGDFKSLPPLADRVPHFESVHFFDDVDQSPFSTGEIQNDAH